MDKNKNKYLHQWFKIKRKCPCNNEFKFMNLFLNIFISNKNSLTNKLLIKKVKTIINKII